MDAPRSAALRRPPVGRSARKRVRPIGEANVVAAYAQKVETTPRRAEPLTACRSAVRRNGGAAGGATAPFPLREDGDGLKKRYVDESSCAARCRARSRPATQRDCSRRCSTNETASRTPSPATM